jgi:SulP family sulfate permease
VEWWPRVTSRIPGPLVAIGAATAAVQIFHLPVETIGSRFGGVSSGFPAPRLPHVEWASFSLLVSPAISIALLAGIESLLSAVVADGMTGRRHRSNAELIAQGVANIASPLFGGIPATGAIARTATNIKNGGRTPVAGVIHAATLLVILLAAGRWAGLVPMAALAGILFVVAFNMSEWHMFVRLFRGPRSDVLVLLVTFLLTVFLDLIVAIQVGVVLAALLFMRRMADVSHVRVVTDQLSEEDTGGAGPELPPGVVVYEIRGSFFFGSAQKFSEVIGHVDRRPRVAILHMRDVFAMDATGIRALEETASRFRRVGTVLLLAGVHAQPLVAMQSADLLDRIGQENMLETLGLAVERSRAILQGGADAAAPGA